MDYNFLRQEGIGYLERMGGLLWTDFNAHDPGITILEQLCYAITDLGYRVGYELPDLLAEDGEGDPSDSYASQSLFSPAQILTCQPVTLTDLRKLVLDVKGVHNAWIEPVSQQKIPLRFHEAKKELSLKDEALLAEPVYLKGLYRVDIEKSNLVDIHSSALQQDVARRLHAHRNLCEDFEEIRVLPPQPIQIQARIKIGPVDDAGQVLLEIYQRISQHISPRIRFHTLQEMLEKGLRVDQIFEGPRLEHGFIETEELGRIERRSEVHTSDLINEIMKVPGVRAVRSISVAAGIGNEDWSLTLSPDTAPHFDHSGSEIVLEKERLTVSLDVAAVAATFLQKQRESAIPYRLPPKKRDLFLPPGRHRQVGKYHSVQDHFPAAYGISEMGLPASAGHARRAQAKQLKAYLMFFDQLLANYFAQLAHVKDLFSVVGNGTRTYFSQAVEDTGLGLEEILVREVEDHTASLEKITEANGGGSLERKGRFLNHLLARFAEQFTDYSLILYGVTDKGAEASGERLIRDRARFLQRYPAISSARGAAFDYLEPAGDTNLSGLEERIRLKLGLAEQEDKFFLVVEHILLRAMEGDEEQKVPLLAATRYRDPYSLQLSFVFPNWSSRFAKKSFQRLIEQTVREETPAHLTPYIHWLDVTTQVMADRIYRMNRICARRFPVTYSYSNS